MAHKEKKANRKNKFDNLRINARLGGESQTRKEKETAWLVSKRRRASVGAKDSKERDGTVRIKGLSQGLAKKKARTKTRKKRGNKEQWEPGLPKERLTMQRKQTVDQSLTFPPAPFLKKNGTSFGNGAGRTMKGSCCMTSSPASGGGVRGYKVERGVATVKKREGRTVENYMGGKVGFVQGRYRGRVFSQNS